MTAEARSGGAVERFGSWTWQRLEARGGVAAAAVVALLAPALFLAQGFLQLGPRFAVGPFGAGFIYVLFMWAPPLLVPVAITLAVVGTGRIPPSARLAAALSPLAVATVIALIAGAAEDDFATPLAAALVWGGGASAAAAPFVFPARTLPGGHLAVGILALAFAATPFLLASLVFTEAASSSSTSLIPVVHSRSLFVALVGGFLFWLFVGIAYIASARAATRSGAVPVSALADVERVVEDQYARAELSPDLRAAMRSELRSLRDGMAADVERRRRARALHAQAATLVPFGVVFLAFAAVAWSYVAASAPACVTRLSACGPREGSSAGAARDFANGLLIGLAWVPGYALALGGSFLASGAVARHLASSTAAEADARDPRASEALDEIRERLRDEALLRRAPAAPPPRDPGP